MKECVDQAETAERPNSSLSSRWEEVAEKVAVNSPIWMGQPGLHPPMWPAPNAGDRVSGKFGSMKGHKILGVGSGGGVTVEESGWEGGVHYLSKGKISEFVGKFGKRVKGSGDKGDREKEREEKKERGKGRDREKREWKEKEKEGRAEWRFVAVGGGGDIGAGEEKGSSV